MPDTRTGRTIELGPALTLWGQTIRWLSRARTHTGRSPYGAHPATRQGTPCPGEAEPLGAQEPHTLYIPDCGLVLTTNIRGMYSVDEIVVIDHGHDTPGSGNLQTPTFDRSEFQQLSPASEMTAAPISSESRDRYMRRLRTEQGVVVPPVGWAARAPPTTAGRRSNEENQSCVNTTRSPRSKSRATAPMCHGAASEVNTGTISGYGRFGIRVLRQPAEIVPTIG